MFSKLWRTSRSLIIFSLLALLAASVTPAIDSGTSILYIGALRILDSITSEIITHTVTYNLPFESLPSFAILLNDFSIRNNPTFTGYTHTYGVVSATTALFSIAVVDAGTMNDVAVRWVATADPLLQLYPVSLTLDRDGAKLYNVPVDLSDVP